MKLTNLDLIVEHLRDAYVRHQRLIVLQRRLAQRLHIAGDTRFERITERINDAWWYYCGFEDCCRLLLGRDRCAEITRNAWGTHRCNPANRQPVARPA